jgi:hypothetical protein
MTNEKPWWEDAEAYPTMSGIVAEAESRGEVKAWEEISDLSLSLVDDDVKLGVKAGERFAVGVQSVANELYDFSKRKLTSLKTP